MVSFYPMYKRLSEDVILKYPYPLNVSAIGKVFVNNNHREWMPGAMFLTRERSKSLIREVAALSRNPYLYSPLQSFSVLVAKFLCNFINWFFIRFHSENYVFHHFKSKLITCCFRRLWNSEIWDYAYTYVNSFVSIMWP